MTRCPLSIILCLASLPGLVLASGCNRGNNPKTVGSNVGNAGSAGAGGASDANRRSPPANPGQAEQPAPLAGFTQIVLPLIDYPQPARITEGRKSRLKDNPDTRWTAAADPLRGEPTRYPLKLPNELELETPEYAIAPSLPSTLVGIHRDRLSNGPFRVIDAATRRELATIDVPQDVQPHYLCAVSRDGRYAATQTTRPSTVPSEVRRQVVNQFVHIYGLQDPSVRWELIAKCRHPSEGSRIQFVGFRDARLVLVVKHQVSVDEVIVFDVAAGTVINRFPTISSILTNTYNVTPGGRYLVFQSRPNEISVYELATGECVGRSRFAAPDQPNSMNSEIGISHDGRRMAHAIGHRETRGGRQYVEALAWDFASGKLLGQQRLFETPASLSETQDALFDAFRARSWGANERRYLGPELRWLAEGKHWLLWGVAKLDPATAELVEPVVPHSAQLAQNSPAASPDTVPAPPDVRPVPATTPSQQPPSADPKPARERRPTRVAADTNPAPPPTSPATPASDSSTPNRSSTGSGAVEAAPEPVPSPSSGWQVAVDTPAAFSVKNKLAVPVSERVRYLLFPRQLGHFAGLVKYDGAGTVIDLSSGTAVGSLPPTDDYRGEGVLSPDGKHFAARPKENGEVKLALWSSVNGKRVIDLERTPVGIDDYAFAGRCIVALEEDSRESTLWVWTRDDGKLLHSIPVRTRLRGVGETLAISPGGRYVGVLTQESLLIYEVESGREVGRALLPQSSTALLSNTIWTCTALAWSRDGTRLAAEYNRNNDRIRAVWDVTTGRSLLHRVYRLDHASTSSGDPELVWSLNDDFLLKRGDLIVDPVTGAEVARLPEDSSHARFPLSTSGLIQLKESEDGQDYVLEVTALPKQALDSGLRVARATPSENIPPTTDPDFSSVSIRTLDGTPAGWNASVDPSPANAQLLLPRTFETADHATFGRFYHEGSMLHVLQAVSPPPEAITRTGMLSPERTVWLMSYPADRETPEHKLALPGQATIVDISPDGSLVMTGDRSPPFRRLDVWAPELKTHAVSWHPKTHAGEPEYIEDLAEWAQFVDKRHVLTLARDTLTLWELPSCRAVYQVRDFGRIPALSPGRKFVAAAHPDHGIRVLDAMTGQHLGTLAEPAAESRTLSVQTRVGFTADGSQLFALGSYGTHAMLTWWDVATGSQVQQFAVPDILGAPSRVIPWGKDQLLIENYGNIRKTVLIDRASETPVHSYYLRDSFLLDSHEQRAGVFLMSVKESKLLEFPIPHAGDVRTDAGGLKVMGPGSTVAVAAQVDVPGAANVGALLEKKLRDVGVQPQASASLRLVLTAQEKQVSTGRRTRVAGTEILAPQIWATIELQDGSGTTHWMREQRFHVALLEPRPGETAEQARLRAMRTNFQSWLDSLALPSHLFVKDWHERLGQTDALKVLHDQSAGN